MSTLTTEAIRRGVRKLTISLPADLVEFADAQASRLQTNRSQIIGLALAESKARAEERLAAEGYLFYAQESSAFAESSALAVAEAFGAYIPMPTEEQSSYER